MAILVLVTSSFVELQLRALRAAAPEETIVTDPDAVPAADVEALLAFTLKPGVAARFPGLRFVACAGAGADELVAASDVPPHVPIVRTVDPMQGKRMAQYVALMVLRWHRELARLEAQHRDGYWKRPAPQPETNYAIGVMGFGSVGAPVTDVLLRLGYPVSIWTRTPRDGNQIACYAGEAGLAPFLARTNVLVCALPLTEATRGLLAAPLFAALPRGACVINVARGALLVENDLLVAVDAEHLAGAALDVFATEPLPPESPLWRHPKILCTPHIAAVNRPDFAAMQLLDNLRRARAGRPLVNVVDRVRGY
jgi:phosphoglycerate dehydrogenase-like enzyme